MRGKWVLENVLGAPPPQPPPGVETNSRRIPQQVKVTSLRQRLELHRANPACASCHRLMDPIGFALENFDHTGKWRTMDGKTPIDATGQLVDGTRLDGPMSLRRALLARSDVFVTVVAEKLLTYAVGRAMRPQDMPAVRAIVRGARPRPVSGSRRSSSDVVKTPQFQMRTKVGRKEDSRRCSSPKSTCRVARSSTAPAPWSRCRSSTRWRRRRRRLRQTAATPKNALRCIYVPHGATMDKWTPATEGSGFEFTEILKPLEPFRDRVNIVSGLAHPYVAGAGGADVSAGANHTRAAAVFLTGAVPERGAQAHLGVSADQVAAQHIGQDTPLPSLELSIEEVGARLRSGVQLRLSQLDLVEVADRSAADAEQPAAGVREAVRRRQLPTRSGARAARSRAACSTR